MSKTIYLLRHGAIERRYHRRFIGSTDVPLSAQGRRASARLAGTFSRLDGLECLSSPLRRARQTARAAAPGLNGGVRFLPALREMDFGRWEGLTFEEISRKDPAGVQGWASFSPRFRFPGGEGLGSFQRRLRRLERLLLRHRARHLLVVSHGGVIRSLLCLWKGKPLRRYPEIQVPPGSVSVVRVSGGRPRVLSVGDVRG